MLTGRLNRAGPLKGLKSPWLNVSVKGTHWGQGAIGGGSSRRLVAVGLLFGATRG